ncbi:MAG: hypothetical protein ACLPYW_05555 [Acidimicrobiales bacterium]
MLFLNPRDDVAQILVDLVTGDVRALAVAPRNWTFSPAGTEPITVSHRRFAAPFPDESERADFARLIAGRAGWPFPSTIQLQF